MAFPSVSDERDASPSMSTSLAANPLLRDDPLLSPLEQDVLDEYARLLDNMNKTVEADAPTQLSDTIADMAARPAAEMLDSLRMLERKTATVCTLLKASVYSIVLQQQIYNDDAAGEQEQFGETSDVMGETSYSQESTQY
ncbi:hypothetical protein KEM54_003737 [Ascosphaera aggregata]|nr:hypothetical protein KEM54_003737 [Ascosphaera aggregata]